MRRDIGSTDAGGSTSMVDMGKSKCQPQGSGIWVLRRDNLYILIIRWCTQSDGIRYSMNVCSVCAHVCFLCSSSHHHFLEHCAEYPYITNQSIHQMSAFTAVVTGATGFVALEVVKQLLEKGYNVRATVRSAADHSKTATLQALGSAFPGKLELFEADLLSPGSFDGAISGADYVFHVASPFRIDVEDPQRDLIDPAVQGTRNVLASVVKNKNTVRRTVITSSVAAVHGGKSKVPPTNGALYTEEDFNKSSTVDNGEAYWASKVCC